MVGHVVLSADLPGRRPRLGEERLAGVRFLRAEVPLPPKLRPARAARRVAAAGRLLAERGVRRVVTAADFPYWSALAGWGLGPVWAAPLCRACAVSLALAALEGLGVSPDGATVALRGERVTPELERAAGQLCRAVRRPVIGVERGGEALAEELRQRYGIPVLADLPRRAPHVALHFDPVPGGGEAVLDLWGPRPRLLGYEPALPGWTLPPHWDPLPLLAALAEEGALRGEDLRWTRGEEPGEST